MISATKAKLAENPSYSASVSGYDEYVLMVDKVVDATWKQPPLQKPAIQGDLSPSDTKRTKEGLKARIVMALMGFFMMLYTYLRLIACRITGKLPDNSSNVNQNLSEDNHVVMLKEEFRPPSPSPHFTEADLLSTALKRMSELEEKVETLQARPSVMPYEKEELLHAAVYRVEALEAELIATKKALHEALMKQEELLAYLDRQQEAKIKKKKFCW